MPPALSLCLIVRDAEKTIERCLDSVIVPTVPRIGGPAFDEVVIADTGSVDSTRELVEGYAERQRKLGGKFLHFGMGWPKHFGRARQISFEAGSCEWRGWLDADDVLEGAAYLKPTLGHHLRAEHSAVVLPYLYAVDKDGRVITRLLRERFVKWADGWQWFGAVHEHLMRQDRAAARSLQVTDGKIQVRHLATVDEITSRIGRNVALLDAGATDNPAERQRVLYHLAEVARASDAERALAIIADALSLPYQDQITRVLCHYLAADIHAAAGRWVESRAQAMRIVELQPELRTGYQAMANTYFLEGRMKEASTWYWLAFSQPRPQSEALAIDDSDDACLAALAIEAAPGPEQETRFGRILADYPQITRASAVRAAQARMRSAEMARRWPDMVRYLVDHDEFEKADELATTLPYTLVRSHDLALLRREIAAYLEDHGTVQPEPHWQPLPLDAQSRADDFRFARSEWARQEIVKHGWRRVLSFGCCDGFIEGWLASRLPEVEFLGYDRSAEAIAHAAKVWDLPNLSFTSDWPETDGFDGAICFELIEHLPFGRDLVEGALPCLYTTPATQPDGGAPHDRFTVGEGGHLRIFTLPELRRAFRPESAQLLQEPAAQLWSFYAARRPVPASSARRRLVVFVCSGAPFAWGPESAHTKGLTGSEECALYLGEALAGFPDMDVVIAVAPLAGSERIVNSVHWVGLDYLAELDIDADRYARTDLVLWRAPTAATQSILHTLPRAIHRILWLHDASYGSLPAEVWANYRRIICATEYHKEIIAQQYPAAEPRIRVIGHGLPLVAPGAKDPNKAIYASSPDRGLVRLLRWWPAVKEVFPDLKLHVFYGRNNIRALADYYPGLHEEIKVVEALLNECAGLDVIDHGLVNHETLHEHFATAGLWLYPTKFEEIACLTALKAQATGAIPVYSPGGCLDETIKLGVRFWSDLDTLDSPEAQKAFVAGIRRARELIGQHLERPSWATRAQQWRDLFDSFATEMWL